MEACTVTALDVITAFAVPNPNCSSQSSRFFRVWLPDGLPLELTTQPTSDRQFYFSQPFQSSTSRTLNICCIVVNAAFLCKR